MTTARTPMPAIIWLVAVLFLGCGCSAAAVTASPGPVTRAATAASTALQALAALPVKGRAPLTGYSRAQFGAAWTDDNHALWGGNGLDTRDDVLSRDLVGIVCRPRPVSTAAHCVVKSGTLDDPYTGSTIAFVRGVDTSALVQIDHVVALADAWQKGAQQLTRGQRIDLANDPLNLIAVDGASNQKKGAGDAATWLPPHKSYRCAYAARQIAVKVKYSLWVSPAEDLALQQVLSACTAEPLPIAALRASTDR
ncbi:HNH endonuclease family protein [Nakamurella panacisegetis]|uniref:HNH endonuclease family protein n=1 Tax=Nakamurella panacisegetis TaxID=1090615 RepID=UPI0018D3B45F|nr:HNH endonuclease family protein [Nakamurella panacisegetis]